MTAVVVAAPFLLLGISAWLLTRYQSSGLGGPPEWTDESIGYCNVETAIKRLERDERRA